MSQAKEMNCEEYRHALTAEPGFKDESRHADDCVECRGYSAGILALDADIARAMKISVPELRMPELPNADVVSFPARRFLSRRVFFCFWAVHDTAFCFDRTSRIR